MRWYMIIAVIAGLAATQAQADSGLRQCRQDIDKAANADWPDGDQVAAHRLFPMAAVSMDPIAPDHYVLAFRFIVDAAGRPLCAWNAQPFGSYDIAGAELARQSLRRQAVSWRYTPFVADGRPLSTEVEEAVTFDAAPAHPAVMPNAPLFASTVTLQRIGCFGTCPNYTVTVHGDGRVDYDGGQYTDVQGKHSWTISPGETAALVERFRSTGIWGMRDHYVWGATDQATYKLRVTMGNQSHSILDYSGERVGMPPSITMAENDVDRVSGVNGLVTLNGDGLRILESEHFDFTSPRGADLLTRALADAEVSDATILALLDHGTPVQGGHAADPAMSYGDPLPLVPALDTALTVGRESVARRLIADGALTGGQSLVDSAFQNAILSGRFDLVELLWTYHPALIFMQKSYRSTTEQAPVEGPVSLLLDRGGATNDAWQDFEIAKFLIAAGCDINAKNLAGNSLLHDAVSDDNRDFVKWLLDHGADIHTVNSENEGPLNAAGSEDMVLDLLDAGADPTLQPEYLPSFFYYVQDYGWTRATAWLKAHGYSDQLAADAPPAKPAT